MMLTFGGNPDELRRVAALGTSVRCCRMASCEPRTREDGTVFMQPYIGLHYTYDGERHGEPCRLTVQERRYPNDEGLVDLSDTIFFELLDDGHDIRLVHRSGSF